MGDTIEAVPRLAWGTSGSCECADCMRRINAVIDSPEMAEARRVLMDIGVKYGMRIWIKGEVLGDENGDHSDG